MLLSMYNFISFRMFRERGKTFLKDAHYKVITLPEHVMIPLPSNILDRFFQEGNNLIITIKPSPEPSSLPFYRSGSIPRLPRSDEEEPYCTRGRQISDMNTFVTGFSGKRSYERQEGHNINLMDNLSGHPLPTYNDVRDSGIERRIVDPGMPPFEKSTVEHTEGLHRSRLNRPPPRPSDTVGSKEETSSRSPI